MFKLQYPWKYEWKHKNLIIIFITTAISVYAITTPEIANLIAGSGSFGYLGAFVAGFFFSTMFSAPLATVALLLLGKVHDPFTVALIAAIGTMMADYIIFKLVRKSIDNLTAEIAELKLFIERHNPIHLSPENLLFHRIKMYLVPIAAGLIIASPLPDESAIAMLGAANYDKKKLLVFAFVANFIGIFVLVHVGRALF